MPFHHFHFLVLRQFSKYRTKVLAQYSEYFLLCIFGINTT